MSRDVLLNVASSAIELADATTTQISPIAIDGAAAAHSARPADAEIAGCSVAHAPEERRAVDKDGR